MKLLLGLAIAVLVAVVFAQRPSATLEPMNWSTISILEGPSAFQVATKKDLLVYEDASNVPPMAKRAGQVQPVMSIRRRNAEGVYVPVGNFTKATWSTNFVSTNGKWVVLFNEGVGMFSVDSNNTISQISYTKTNGGYVLSDDTFVGWILNFVGNFTISTYQYEASNNTWIKIPAAELIVTTEINFMGEFSSYRATDTDLVIIDKSNSSNIHVQIYSRQADKSWKFVESVPVNSSFALNGLDGSVNYNGVDTLILSTNEDSADNEVGFMFVYTKTNGQWTEQTITTSSVGYRPQGNFGAVTSFLDANTLLVTADMEGYNVSAEGAPSNVGKVLLMTRNSNGMWEPSLDFNNPTGSGLWGAAVGFNDHDVIIPNFDLQSGQDVLTFYTVPRCFADPINATCNDQQVSDCSQLDVTKVDVSSLYTINNAQCGQLGAINVTVDGVSLVNKAVQAQFSFSRSFGQSVTCNATVTCPASPVTAQTPSQSSSPSKVSGAVVLVHSCLASLVLGFAILFI